MCCRDYDVFTDTSYTSRLMLPPGISIHRHGHVSQRKSGKCWTRYVPKVRAHVMYRQDRSGYHGRIHVAGKDVFSEGSTSLLTRFSMMYPFWQRMPQAHMAGATRASFPIKLHCQCTSASVIYRAPPSSPVFSWTNASEQFVIPLPFL